ncbi:hypothetical protein N7501_001648 [Penicillium viridicatum]|nr:hypothetical protein N7501_001648 [Penicillium viridicatum]
MPLPEHSWLTAELTNMLPSHSFALRMPRLSKWIPLRVYVDSFRLICITITEFHIEQGQKQNGFGAFFDPLKLLRVAPLLTTTSALLYAWDEHWYLSGFLRSEHKSKTETILPSYFRRFFEQGVFIIAGLNTLTVSTSVAHLLIDRPVLDRLRSNGTELAWASLFVTFDCASYRRWVDIHRIRVFVADLPA